MILARTVPTHLERNWRNPRSPVAVARVHEMA